MRLNNNEIAKIIFTSFKETFENKDKGKLKESNPFRSSYFVSLVGKKIEESFRSAKSNFQSIESIENTNKKGGEWLYDICFTRQIEVKDEKYKGTAKINTNILLACESEFETSLSAFTTDFGKLICSNANQITFIQGLNQSTKTGRIDFIESRKNIIKNQLHDMIRDDFVLAFIPTPGKYGEMSFWDKYADEVLEWASIWIYDKSDNDFIPYLKTRQI